MPHHIFSALLDALEEEYGKVNQSQLAKSLGVSQGTISNWKNDASPSKTNLKKLLDFYRNHHATTLIRPILEFQEIQPERSGKSWNFTCNKELSDQLRQSLHKKAGLYLLYDSAGNGIDLGKSETNLFIEAKQRLNAKANRAFYAPTKKTHAFMGEMAQYVSAYKVTIPSAIKNLKSFMLRSFANNLMNQNGGNFKSLMEHG